MEREGVGWGEENGQMNGLAFKISAMGLVEGYTLQILKLCNVTSEK